jgi:polyphosphate kinase 2 (PPK2 family)
LKINYQIYDTNSADKNQALLIILQGIDTSGKDGTIRHVMMHLIHGAAKMFHLRNK